MSDFAADLRQRARAFTDSQQVSDVLEECLRRLQSIADGGKYSVPWCEIKQQAWNLGRDAERAVLKRLQDEGIEVFEHPHSNGPREKGWTELKW